MRIRRPQKVVTHYNLRHLEQPDLGAGYASLVTRVHEIMHNPAVVDEIALVVDATGVGAAVIEMLQVKGLRPIPVVITGGSAVGKNQYGWYTVPKVDLISPLQLLFQARRLQFAKGMRLTPMLTRQLTEFRRRITRSSHVEMEGEGEHDDLVSAVSLAAWYAEMIEHASLRDGLVDQMIDDDNKTFDPLTWGLE